MRLLAKNSLPGNQRSSLRALYGCLLGVVGAFLFGCAPQEPENPGTEPHIRVITTEQYLNSLEYIFGPSIDLEVEFPPLQRRDGLLANSAASEGISDTKLQQFQRAASSVAAQVVDAQHRDYLIPCTPASIDAPDAQCATEFLSETGRLLYRRPLSDVELTAYVEGAAQAATKLNDFYAGLAVALEGMLISPNVLFIVEHAEPDPKAKGNLRLDAYSLASRLSFFLWNASPDSGLLDAAANGELQTKAGLVRSVDRMMASPRLVDGVRAFFSDMLRFDEFATLSKDPLIYPTFTSVTAAAAREQTLRTVIDHLVTNEQDYRDLYTTRSTFISPVLAALYGMPATTTGWAPYTFPPDSARIGLQGHVSFLALNAHPGRSSPTLRGMAVREVFLCQTVPPPPPGVDFSALENPDSDYPTQRARVAQHVENPSCAGCHKIMDPIGLALENFNGAGSYRLKQNGVLIDTSGMLDGVEYDNVAGLALALHDNPALPSCLVERVFSYGTGGPTSPEDRALLEYLNENFATEGYRVPGLLRTIALSDAFSRIRTDPEPAAPAERQPERNQDSTVTVTENTAAQKPLS